jgi:uncharacterized alpha-E superfamily protein
MLSRVADHLYWMSRYLERAENTARIIDVYLNLILDPPPRIERQHQIAILLGNLEMTPDSPHDDYKELVFQLTFDESQPASVLAQVTMARENARYVREQISSEMWLQVNRMYLDLREAANNPDWWDEPNEFFNTVKSDIHLMQGITDSTMMHNQGWHFIQVGRYLERIVRLSTVLRVYMEKSHNLDDSTYTADYYLMLSLLKSVTAFEAYCKVYSPDLFSNGILEFLLFNAEFPHSGHFCVNELLNSINALSEATMTHKNGRLQRLAGRLQSNLSYTELAEVLESSLSDYLGEIRRQAYSLHDAIYNTYISYPIESALR